MRSLPALSFPPYLRGEVKTIERQILKRDRSRPHYKRKAYHALMGLMCFCLYAFVLTRGQAIFALAFVGGAFVVLDLCRLRSSSIRLLSLRIFGDVMRQEELNGVSANSFYVAGLIVVTAIFPKWIALLAILYLAIGDPIAAIVGTRWGRHRLGLGGFSKKSLEGSAANAIAAALATAIFALSYMNLGLERVALIALMGGAASMVAEALPLPIDDNFTIPVVSATLLYLATSLSHF